MFDVVSYEHHTFGFRDKSPAPKYPFGCHDQPEPGASGEASCLWDAMFTAVRHFQKAESESLQFQACMERGWSPFTGQAYVPYAWLNPSHSTKGHAPYQPSNYTLGCVRSTTTIKEEAFRSCLGLEHGQDHFIGSKCHSLLMQEYAFSEATFKAANLTEAGPTIFVDGKHHGDLDGAGWDGSGELPKACRYRLLDALCEAAAKAGHKKPAGCKHDED